MPPKLMILIIACVIAAAAVTVWLAATMTDAFQMPVPGWMIVVSLVLALSVIVRAISGRTTNAKDDDHDSSK